MLDRLGPLSFATQSNLVPCFSKQFGDTIIIIKIKHHDENNESLNNSKQNIRTILFIINFNNHFTDSLASPVFNYKFFDYIFRNRILDLTSNPKPCCMFALLDLRHQFQQAFNRVRGRASSFDHPSYSQTTTNNTLTFQNPPITPESSISETIVKKSKRKGVVTFDYNAVKMQPEEPSLVIAATKAATNRVEFELTTIVVNSDGNPDSYRAYPSEVAC